jgi:hypothetical protein
MVATYRRLFALISHHRERFSDLRYSQRGAPEVIIGTVAPFVLASPVGLPVPIENRAEVKT